MKKNVGTLDALIRISFGLFGLGWSTSKMTRFPYRGTYILVGMMSAMKVAEGITRYCPMLDMIGVSTNENEDAMGEKSTPQ